MTITHFKSGLAQLGDARIYYEVAGAGKPFVMIHAGVADSRQWNNEFPFFARHYRVVRYDQRGYGKSEPVDGEFSHLQDLTALLDFLKVNQPAVLMGCSMGGGLALDFALTNPARARAVIMVDSGPGGLELETPAPADFEAKFEQAEKAFKSGDLDRTAELETQIWFDGVGRSSDQVNQEMRRLAYEMNLNVLAHEVKHLGKRLPNLSVPAAKRLDEISLPVLLIAGEHDEPYTFAAADYMLEKIPSARKAVIANAAHLPNLEHPAQFQKIVSDFLDTIPAEN